MYFVFDGHFRIYIGLHGGVDSRLFRSVVYDILSQPTPYPLPAGEVTKAEQSTACHLSDIERGIFISPNRLSRNVGAIYEGRDRTTLISCEI